MLKILRKSNGLRDEADSSLTWNPRDEGSSLEAMCYISLQQITVLNLRSSRARNARVAPQG